MAPKKIFTVALAGNPNCGKSTVFNNLTGARQHVGNYPGATVEKKEGCILCGDYGITVVDLPGTYGLSASSDDERVTRDFILHEKPDVVVHVVDASSLERNLYLTTQLIELGAPLILAVNMVDLLSRRGLSLDYVKLGELLKARVVLMVASKNEGTRELLSAIVEAYEKRHSIDDRVMVDYGPEITEEVKKIEQEIVKDKVLSAGYLPGWLAVKLLEQDAALTDRLMSSSNVQGIKDALYKSRHHLAAHFSETPEVLIADRRYGFVGGVCAQVVVQAHEDRISMTEKIDRIVLSRALGIPIFALVMYLIFKFTFVCSAPVVLWLESVLGWLGETVGKIMPGELSRSLVVDGMIGGVGVVLGFFPLVLFMFLAIAFFEDSGYMARAAFVMDKFMSRFGLQGKAFLPLMISTNGCAVPGLLATRTLENQRDRLITMMVTPFMICGAKLPIFALFIAAFFSAEQGPWLMMLMYVLSILIALSSAWALKTFVFKGSVSHFVMELPPYRMPTLKGLLLKMWERGWLYLQKAGSIILVLSILIWAAFKFPQVEPPPGMPEQDVPAYQLQQSYAGQAGQWMEPVLRPIGMDGKAGIALIAGLAAKEIVVSTLGTSYSLGAVDPQESDSLKSRLAQDVSWTPLKAFSFLMFCLIYSPCVVTLTVFYRETGSRVKWLLFLFLWTTLLAWILSFSVYQGGMLLGWGG